MAIRVVDFIECYQWFSEHHPTDTRYHQSVDWPKMSLNVPYFFFACGFPTFQPLTILDEQTANNKGKTLTLLPKIDEKNNAHTNTHIHTCKYLKRSKRIASLCDDKLLFAFHSKQASFIWNIYKYIDALHFCLARFGRTRNSYEKFFYLILSHLSLSLSFSVALAFIFRFLLCGEFFYPTLVVWLR